MMRTLNLKLPALLIVCLAFTAMQSLVHAEGRDEVVLYHTDILGTAVAAFDEDHRLCWSESYTPYGDKTEGSDAIPRVGCGLVGEERGYTGHTEDYSTDLVYMQQRYYDPSMGRFLSTDPIGPNPADPRTFNRYSYAANNPYKYVDPTGELFFLAPVAAFVAKEVIAEVASRATSGATDFLSMRRMATKGVKAAAKLIGKNKSGSSTTTAASDVAKEGDDSVSGYRAVSRAEADDIAEHGFRPNPNGQSMQDKWFSETQQGAEMFRDNYTDLEKVVKTKVPREVYERSYKHSNIDSTGPGFCVACDDLKQLKPEQ